MFQDDCGKRGHCALVSLKNDNFPSKWKPNQDF